MITRRTFLKYATASAALTLPASKKAFAQKNKRLRWRLALAVPKTLPIWGEAMERFSKNVELLSEGQLRIKIYGAGELVPALGTFDAVKKGEIQMGHAAAYYWIGKEVATPFFTAIPFGMRAAGMNAWLRVGDGQKLWDELMAPFGVKCLPCGNVGYQATGWFKKEIKSIDDMKGLKMRVGGLAGKVYAKAGVKPILLPGGELFTGLATGVIDAVEWIGPYHDYIMGFQKAASYLYGSSWHEPGSVLELMMHKQSWDDLPEHLKKIIELSAAEIDIWMQAQFETKNAEYLEKLKAEGKVSIQQFPESALKVLKKHAETLQKETAASSPLAMKIYKSFTEFHKTHQAYQDWSGRF